VLDRLLEAATRAVDHVLVKPGGWALGRGDEQDLVGREVVERVGNCLDRVGVGELNMGMYPVSGEARRTCA
jgi:hypothetical protein